MGHWDLMSMARLWVCVTEAAGSPKLCQNLPQAWLWAPSVDLTITGYLPLCFCFYSRINLFVQLLRHVQFFATPWTAARQASLFFTISWSLVKLMPIESVMPSNHPILCHPLLLSPSVFPSVRVFSSESTLCIRWPKYWIFSFNSNPSDEYSGLISFRIDWYDFLEVQGTLKSLLQHNSETSILRHSAFFMIQFSHPFITSGKT